jgi:succinate dehydrogenase / fumarate reductase cytochrome b subunit
MSTLAINPVHRVVRFYEAPIGKKVIMAITGVILFGYVVAHLLGNLQIYLPAGADGDIRSITTRPSFTVQATWGC